jgi:SAM-dependent methyltransferase
MKNEASNARPSACGGGLLDTEAPIPYAFEQVQEDGGGSEVARLEAQNLLFEKTGPLGQLPMLAPDAAILDVGSGTGFWSLRLAARIPQGRITCLDRSRELLDLARNRLEGPGATRAEFLHQDLRRLDLPDRAYDLVFTSVTLAHVHELEVTLAKLVAALKPGGWIACFEPAQQARQFCELHPPCPNLSLLMDHLLEEVQARGSDLSVGLKLAHGLERLGLEETVMRSYGTALHGEDLQTCIREVFLPLVGAYLRHRFPPGDLASRMDAAAQEATLPHLWLDFRRSVVLARKPA